MTAQPHADPAAVQRRASKVARDVAALLATVEELTGERDRAVDAAAALEQELAVKDEALAELRKVVYRWGLTSVNPNTHTRRVIADCVNEIRPVLDALAARIDVQLFPTDEEGAVS